MKTPLPSRPPRSTLSLDGAYEVIELITGKNAKMFTMQVPITIELAEVAPYRSLRTGQPHLGLCFREALNYLQQRPDVILVYALMIGSVVRRWLGLPWRHGLSIRRAVIGLRLSVCAASSTPGWVLCRGGRVVCCRRSDRSWS